MAVPAWCFHPPLSQLLLPAFCTFPPPSIPSLNIHSSPIALSAALLPPTSSLSPLFDPFLSVPSSYYSHFHAEDLCFWIKKDTAKDRKAVLLLFFVFEQAGSFCPYFLSPTISTVPIFYLPSPFHFHHFITITRDTVEVNFPRLNLQAILFE